MDWNCVLYELMVPTKVLIVPTEPFVEYITPVKISPCIVVANILELTSRRSIREFVGLEVW